MRKSDYILLPDTKNHSQLLVMKYRLSEKDPQVKEAMGKTKVNFMYDFRREDWERGNREYGSEYGYIGEIRRHEAFYLLSQLGHAMLTPRAFFDFILLLRSRKKVYDRQGKEVSNQERKSILADIFHEDRGEWLDAYIWKEQTGKFTFCYGHEPFIKERKDAKDKFDRDFLITATKKERLDPCLSDICDENQMRSSEEDVSVDLTSINWQGMPTKKGNDFDCGALVERAIVWEGGRLRGYRDVCCDTTFGGGVRAVLNA